MKKIILFVTVILFAASLSLFSQLNKQKTERMSKPAEMRQVDRVVDPKAEAFNKCMQNCSYKSDKCNCKRGDNRDCKPYCDCRIKCSR